MRYSELQNRLISSVKTFLAHLAILVLVPFLATILVKSFVFGRGFSDLQIITTHQFGSLAQSFADGRFGVIYLTAAYAVVVALVSYLTRSHRFWHVLTLWFFFYFPVTYVIINHDAAWAMYLVLVAPLTGIAALCAWLVSRRFWRPAI